MISFIYSVFLEIQRSAYRYVHFHFDDSTVVDYIGNGDHKRIGTVYFRYGFSMWIFSTKFRAKLASHTPHLNGRSPECFLKMKFRLLWISTKQVYFVFHFILIIHHVILPIGLQCKALATNWTNVRFNTQMTFAMICQFQFRLISCWINKNYSRYSYAVKQCVQTNLPWPHWSHSYGRSALWNFIWYAKLAAVAFFFPQTMHEYFR